MRLLSTPPLPSAQQGTVVQSVRARLNNLLFSEIWAIGIVRAPIQSFLDHSFVPSVEWINQCGPLEYLADCFGVIEGNNRFILAERFSYRDYMRSREQYDAPHTGRGYITSLSITQSGLVESEGPAIDTGLHMSYPYTLLNNGSWYCVAEESNSRSVNLYRRNRDRQWQHVKQLLPFGVVDPTVLRFQERWWMFGTTPEQPSSELRIWHSEELEGPWMAHCNNPVRDDLRSARPAGTPFIVNGTLYRPAQNCTKTYGGSIVINKVDVLTVTSFEEHQVREVCPVASSPFTDGIHTMSAFGEWTLIDSKRHVVLPEVILRRAYFRLSKAWRSGNDITKITRLSPR